MSAATARDMRHAATVEQEATDAAARARAANCAAYRQAIEAWAECPQGRPPRGTDYGLSLAEKCAVIDSYLSDLNAATLDMLDAEQGARDALDGVDEGEGYPCG